MRYKRFVIRNYRAITGPLEIRVDKGTLMPIIGVNESGKTTILHAIFAFDHYNDESNDGRHLNDVMNLYRSSSPAASVEAEVETTPSELRKIFAACGEQSSGDKAIYEELARRKKLPGKLTIRRMIRTREYTISGEYFGNDKVHDTLARAMLKRLPYILYFDDFRDKVAEKIEIPPKDGPSAGEWFEILEELFKHTDGSYTLFALAQMEERQRKTVLSHVQRHLNRTLTREWQSFRLDDRDALKIHIEFAQEELPAQGAQQPPSAPRPPQPPAPAPPSPPPSVKNYVKLEVVETDPDDSEHFFFISDRSKGFYWFFNFVMKLEFNPKVADDLEHSIYLLDEPGSYLHAYAQRKLCTKLRQIAEKNHVIYCTHSHYLLDPDTIPINCVMVADKDEGNNIRLTRMIDYREKGNAPWSALQPVLDALQIKPYALDLVHARTTVITEGIYDYYCLELFRGSRPISILPCLGAESIKKYIPLMIAWQVDFRALWDNDPDGRKEYARAQGLFGDVVAERTFRLLPCSAPNCRWIMQNLFEGGDLVKIRHELGIADDTSFERTVLALYYSAAKQDILDGVSDATKARFEELFTHLGL
jgi:energy-coupling factor transporter ATP-binding protein EcfA2